MAGEENSKTFSITLPMTIHDELVDKGKALQMKRSAYIRHVLIKHIEEERGKENQHEHP